ncbi:MAG: toxin-antitoxin system HicB family antitoxin [Clostridia bacterium]|nr:toxin-antitoxin system HicB family antitoxin [Clostridia bacterium]
MRTIDEYMRLPYRMEIIPDTAEGGYVVRFPELPGCLTCADTLEEAVRNAADCKKEWLTAAMEDGIDIPEPVSEDEYSGQFKLRIPKSLHKSLAEHSKAEGISMNQYCLYLLAKNDASFRTNV